MKSLRHKGIVEDSLDCAPGPADYLLIFKKPGDNPIPVEHPDGLRDYAGEEEIPQHLILEYYNFTGDQRVNRLSHWIWRRYASPVWMDIDPGGLLPYVEARESDEEKHVCPLQLQVIERLLVLYSNPGEIVLTPFLGVGSEIYKAVQMGRRGIGSELKPSYFRQAAQNISHAKDEVAQTKLRLDGPATTVDDDLMD
jgi:DNA modification methylase